MTDPLAEVVALLQPGALFSKSVSGSGAWQVRRTIDGQPFYCAVIAGGICLTVDGMPPVTLGAGDFVLIPAAYGYTTSSLAPSTAQDMVSAPIPLPQGGFRLGRLDGPPDVQLLIGHCAFGSPDAALLVSLLPQLVLVRGEARLATLVQLVGEEARANRPARDMVVSRLLEVLLIEALRATPGSNASPGLLRGLTDDRLATVLRALHEAPGRAWTVAELANKAALSRSAFFARFTAAIGQPPMDYLTTWRMALAKPLLRQNQSIALVAAKTGYASASAFSTAFTRHTGQPPATFARGSGRAPTPRLDTS